MENVSTDHDDPNERSKKKRKQDKEYTLSTVKSVAYNRCRKPFVTTTACSTKDLRKVGEELVTFANSKFTITPKLTTADRFCNACRKMLSEMCESSQETTTESM